MRVTQNGWFIIENPAQMHDLKVITPTGNLHLCPAEVGPHIISIFARLFLMSNPGFVA